MSITEEKLAQIEKYLDGAMKPDEQYRFELELQSDNDLKEYLNFISSTIPAIEELATHKLKNRLFEKEQKIKRINKQLHVLRIIVVFSILISVGLIVFYFIAPSENNSFETFYQPFTEIIEGQNISNENSAFDFYTAKKYDQAIDAFLRLPSSSTKSFYLGQCYMSKKDYFVAMKYFDQSLDDPVFHGPASWYKALCYLKTGDEMQCSKLLDQLILSDNQYSDRAILLKSEIN